MSLSLRQKRNFYHELGQLLRSGTAFPAAIQLLLHDTHGALRRLMTGLHKSVEQGKTVGEAFADQAPAISHLEVSIISACGRTGRLEQGCAYLSDYFGRLYDARVTILRSARYPAFVLHFGVFLLPAIKLTMGGSQEQYLRETIGFLLLLYACIFLLVLLVRVVSLEGARSVFVDRFLRLVPVVGPTRRAFALARFCATYEMQLQSGVNVIDSLLSAAEASQSALVNRAARNAVPGIRAGSQVGPLLSGSGAFTDELLRAIRIGEETGQLDAELLRMVASFREESITRLQTLSSFLSKAIYFGVLLYTGWQIVETYKHMLEGAMKAFQ